MISANIRMENRRLSRRTLLRGAGTLMGLPLLDAMGLPAQASDRDGPAGRQRHPARMAFIYTPNGVNVYEWFPKDDGPDYTLSPTLLPLKSLKRDFTVISGLYHPNALGTGHAAADTWLTAEKIFGHPGKDYQNSISADQIAAEQFGASTRFSSLELSIAGGTGKPGNSATLAFSPMGVALPAESNLRVAFERMFLDAPDGQAEAIRSFWKQKSVLDSVMDDAKNLHRKLGANDRQKLEEYLTAVRETEMRVHRAEEWQKIPKPKVDGAQFQKSISRDEISAYFRTTYDLMVLAFQNDSTRVITYLSGSESTGLMVPEIGIHQLQHSLSHHHEDPKAKADLARIDTFLLEQFAYFLNKLKAVKEGEGSLLDSTLVLYGSGMSNGNAHQMNNLPILLAGGAGLGIRHKGHLDLLKDAVAKTVKGEALMTFTEKINDQARMSNLLLTMLKAAGVPVKSFKDNNRLISELLA